MRKIVMLGGLAATVMLAWTSAGSQAFARGWSTDYVGNEWIGANMREARGEDEDGAPKRKRTRTSKAESGDVESAPAPKKRRRASVADSDSSGGSSYQSGVASYYWQPQKVASGGWFNPNAMTAAHKSLPFGTKVRVTNKRNGRSVTVTINDRGPYIAGRVIDLSVAAAGAIGMKGAGLAPVELAVLGR